MLKPKRSHELFALKELKIVVSVKYYDLTLVKGIGKARHLSLAL
jgi:hypothetical protein